VLRHQLLVYPVTTTDLERGMDPQYDGVMLERDELQWHQDNYLPSPEAATDPRVDILGADLSGLPDTTIILAECDPIRPQGEQYAKALEAAGVPTRSHLTPGMVHGFFGLDEVFPSATEAMTFAGQRLAEALARVGR
jgi:acetyl esterase/lipase